MTFRIATDEYTGIPEMDLTPAPHDDDPPMGDEAVFSDGSTLSEGMKGDHPLDDPNFPERLMWARGEHEVNRGAW